MKADFETEILSYLRNEKFDTLYHLSDLYRIACVLLRLDAHNTQAVRSNQAKIRRRLLKMKEKGLIEIRRTGTDYLGRTDTGASWNNTYSLPGFWDRK